MEPSCGGDRYGLSGPTDPDSKLSRARGWARCTPRLLPTALPKLSGPPPTPGIEPTFHSPCLPPGAKGDSLAKAI